MELKPEVPDDFLESSVLLEESHYQEGYRDGYNDGLVSGTEEAREVGLKTGFEVGEELGFYQGCVDVWESVMKVAPGVFSSRLRKGIEQLGEFLRKYPLAEPEDEHAQEIMDAIRLKFKICSANLGVKLAYDGCSKSSKQGVEI